MLDINHIRHELARHLSETASHRHSLDAAVMHVVEIAYRRGLEDGRAEMSARNVSDDNFAPMSAHAGNAEVSGGL